MKTKNNDTRLPGEQALFRSAIEGAPIAMSLSDLEGVFFFHNRAFQKLLGYSLDDLKDTGIEKLVGEKSIEETILKMIADGESFSKEIDVIGKLGTVIPVMFHANPVPDENGSVTAFLCIYTDMTGAKEVEKKLIHQREYLSTLHSISLGMFRRLDVSDLLNEIIVRASNLTGIPNGFLHLYDPKKNLLTMRAACGTFSRHIGSGIRPGKGLAGKVYEIGKPMIIEDYRSWIDRVGEISFEDIRSIVCIPLVSGSKIEGVIGLSHDREDVSIGPEIISILDEFSGIAQIAIDNARLFENQKLELEKRIVLEKERKEMELRLLQAQKMESIGTLAGGIAHDFNNILSAIMGYTQIALADSPKGSTCANDLNEIYKASLRAKDLVQQILTFARQSDEKLNAVKISLILKEVLKFIRSSIPSTIAIEQNITSISKVMGNPTRIYQMFLNLFTNASQAMEKRGGTLKVDMQDIALTEPSESLRPGHYIRIIISDTGTGITKSHIHHIFEPYFTTKKKGEGTGLGLAVVHGAVKNMKGEIFVESEPEKGTIFTLHLPCTEESIENDSLEKDGTVSIGREEHILFVDDEVSINQLWKRLFESMNYRVTALDSSLEALDLFRAAPEDFHVVVTDMTMPGMKGDRLAEELKKIRPDIPVILCTGFDSEMSDQEFKTKGIDYYCRKPVLKAELAAVVRKAIDRL
ncbi:MAG: ATP-binding protein [Desulfobacula sp.]